ncbi:squalene synthase HpnC [Skermania sp. ID1734]|uniref:squalene synthase HpnC n=1 Tax=Skermania sp. ID1734 TaxID=2597516 RepID=UPI00117CA267|nr:squalene synthase HpnC [Skermania sp. ID1734]TSE00326.1 squalene synthase HpnC [Skermania sp. ID1734]
MAIVRVPAHHSCPPQPAVAAAGGQFRDRESGENFPVALRMLPSARRRDLQAVYAVARLIDETGDTALGGLTPTQRSDSLIALREDLARVWTGSPTHPVLAALVPTVRDRGLQPEPFEQLIEANLRDQRITRYQTFPELLDYCRLSANPVGRLVLDIFGQSTPDAVQLSDRVCTALQLLEHWQDVSEDWHSGRIYLPSEDLDRYGVNEAALGEHSANPALRELMQFEIARASELLDSGAAITRQLTGWARLAVEGYVCGGRATVRALQRTGGDVLACEARPRKTDLLRAWVQLRLRETRGGR